MCASARMDLTWMTHSIKLESIEQGIICFRRFVITWIIIIRSFIVDGSISNYVKSTALLAWILTCDLLLSIDGFSHLHLSYFFKIDLDVRWGWRFRLLTSHFAKVLRLHARVGRMRADLVRVVDFVWVLHEDLGDSDPFLLLRLGDFTFLLWSLFRSCHCLRF